MKNKKNKTTFKKLFIGVITILFFIVFLFFLSLAYSFYKDPNKLLFEYSHSNITLKSEEIYAGEKIQGSIMSRESNLGIIAIRFETYGRKNTDLLIFRLKEKNEQNWHYVREYESRMFAGYAHFPFGFPIIVDSKGKTYVFELESLKGEKGNAVAIDENEPIIISKYKFSKDILLNNKSDLVFFFLQKSLEIIRSTSFQSLFGMLLFFLLTVIILVNIFSFQRNTSSKKITVNKKNIATGFYNRTGVFFINKNIIAILFIGSVLRIMILKIGITSEDTIWQFISSFSIEQLILSLQKQWQPLVFDIGSFFIIYKYAQENNKSGLIAGALFFLHPVTIMLSGISGILLNAGIFFSLFITLHYFKKEVIFKWKKQYIITIFVMFVFFIFPAYWMPIKMFGLGGLLLSICTTCETLIFFKETLYVVAFIAVGSLFFLAFPVKNPARLFLLLILCFLSFTPIFLVGYIWLPISFGSLFRTKWYYFFSIVSSLFFFAKNILLVFPFSPITLNYIWFLLILWFVLEIKENFSIINKVLSAVLKKIDEFN